MQSWLTRAPHSAATTMMSLGQPSFERCISLAMCASVCNACTAQEYDFEDAQIVDSNLTKEDIKDIQRKREQAKGKTSAEEDGPVKFQKRKVEVKKDSQSASAKKLDGQYGAGLSKKKQRLSFEEDEDE